MTKKRTFKSALTTSLVALIGVLTISSLAGAIVSVVNASLAIDTLPSFQSTVGDSIFYCYKISGSGYEDKVAVAWGKDPSTTPDGTLEIPQTLYSDNSSDTTPYTVAAIANSGFHRCDFKYVSLPETVEEIGKGAFAYCEKLADIRIPHLVDTIQSSTFVSCRGLKTISYSENVAEEGQPPVYASTSKNTVITRIEDHAFDSCVSLIQFECPKSLVYIGKSAFQNCNKITRFYLPEKSTYGNITIDSYAFADCSSLNWVYFEENLATVNDYAFVDCKTSMLFHYAYDESGGDQPNPEFSTYWRRKSLNSGNTAVYDFEDASSIIRSADGYPGLKVAIDTRPIMLDSWKSTSDSSSNTVQLDPGTGGYAVIYQWDNPGKTVHKTGDDFDYYDIGDGTDGDGILTIPHTVEVNGVDYPIKVIAEEAFKEITDFKEIHFKSKMVDGNLHGVVQIQKYAFQDCTNVRVIDFDGLTSLKEIGQSIFNTPMSNITSLKLPASLQYIGPYAFKDFRNVSILSFTTPDDDTNSRLPQLRVIANHAFTNIGANLTGSNYLYITLPCSLDDSYVKAASMNDGGSNWAAVGPYAFSGDDKVNNRIATVTMAECNHTSNPNHSSVKTSFGTNAFERANKLVRFTANKNLCYIGSNAFNYCGALKEIFLTTQKAAATNKICWGTSDGGTTAGSSIFGSSSCQNLVIYLDGNVPSKINSHNNNDTSGKGMWNSVENSYYINLGYASGYTGRKTIPTFTSVDFTKINETSIIYYKPSTGQTLTTSPSIDSDYFQGLIVFVKQGSKYTAAHYYTNNTNKTEEIDLRNISHTYSGGTVNISANLTTIGPEAFASDSTSNNADQQAPCPGKYFILPSSVTKIEERAFFRKVADNPTAANVETHGVAIVTTDSGGTPLGGLNSSYAAIKTDFSTNKYGYCNITNVTYIGNDAFFNNSFKEVKMASGLNHLGRSVFYNRAGTKLTDISFNGSNSYFTIVNNGIYYTANADKKALLYQLQDVSGVAGTPKTLTIESDTKAIGPAAITKTGYQKIELVSGLTQVYGSSFQGNTSLETLGIKSGDSYDLEYIGANPYQITAYKIEKYKYLINEGAQTEHVDDLPAIYGNIGPLPVTSSGPSVHVSYIEEGNKYDLWPFTTTTGWTIYGANKTITNDKNGKDTLMYQIPFATSDTDVLGLNDSLPFDLIDYRDMINPNYANTKNRNNTFRDCTNLKMVDFRSMTKLKKIGHAAFKGCTNLMNINLGRTYNYYGYNKTTHTLTRTASVNSKVLDLSMCTNLVSIGFEAFAGCNNISYAHLPFTNGRLFVQNDPHTENQDIKGKVFENNGITILVGDKEIRANAKTHSAFGGLAKHYPSDWQGTNPIYYYAPDGGAKSLYAGNTSVKYWTQDTTHDANGYILFQNYNEAKDYFDNIGSVVWPS